MSWLRLDDGFIANPKIAALTDKELRVWLRVLCYCARYDAPLVGQAALQETPGLTGKVVSRLAELGLLDDTEDGYEVHDWILYTPSPVSEKVAHYLGQHPDATANEVVRAVAGKRELVLSEVRRLRLNGSYPVPEEPA